VKEKSPKRSDFRAGFVAIVGRPNAGKSTLLNRVVGQKVAIVTAKPQTTRNRIQGIVTSAKGQIVFIDTPGLHEADSALGRQMMHEVAAALEGIDVLLLPGASVRGFLAAGKSETISRQNNFGAEQGRSVAEREAAAADRCVSEGV
jgi:GTPase Era involved in 16S rRNA processing